MTQNHQPEEKQEDWMAKRWRPAMGWLYMAVCAFDFIVAPVLWSMTQAYYHIVPFVQWQPLTLQGAGLFHLAMGAVLGIAAYGRTKEKMAGAEQGGLHTGPDLSAGFGPGAGTTYVPPNAMTMNTINQGNQPGMGGGFNNSPAFGGPSTYSSPAPAFGGTSLGGNTMSTAPAFGSAPAFGTSAPACPTTGRPLGPAQSFPAL
jgi:Holin of 3TMs, for gene-transfer release